MDNRARHYPKRANPAAIPEIAQRLRLLRKAVAANQTELCAMTGITRAAWSNYENARERIGVDAAMKLCAKYPVSLDWVYRGNEALMPDDLKKRLQDLDAEGPPVEGMAEVSPDGKEGDLAVPEEAPVQEDGASEPLTIAEAKRRLALSLGIAPSNIKITIEA